LLLELLCWPCRIRSLAAAGGGVLLLGNRTALLHAASSRDSSSTAGTHSFAGWCTAFGSRLDGCRR
jgi:hypothetical protein